MQYTFKIADWRVDIAFESCDEETGMHLLPSFSVFATDGLCDAPLLTTMTVCKHLEPVDAAHLHHVRDCDTGNGITVVHRCEEGGYQFSINDIHGNFCALLIANADFTQCRCMVSGSEAMRSFGLNNSLMMAYAFAGSHHDTLLVHASVVRHNGKGYAFVAPSGTGKSTQTANWLSMVEQCDLINDDNPVVRIIQGSAFIYGSPWSGKTPCYRQVSVPLAAVTRIDRAPSNSVQPLSGVEAFAQVLQACSTMKWDKAVFGNLCNTVTHLASVVKVYVLHCTAEPESAVVCSKGICS